MAKDRFSRFKKSNYNNTFRYGNNSMNYVSVGKRDKLSQQQREFILQLLKGCNTEYSKKFLTSILVENKVPTVKQKIVIKKMLNE
jgi:hypothetical protein